MCGRRAVWVGLAALIGSAAAARAQRTTPVDVDAVVCDAAGQPVVGAEFADRWTLVAGEWRGAILCNEPHAKAPLRSVADGRLRGVWTMDPLDTPLIGWSADRRSVAIVVPRATADHALVVREPIVLRPAVVLTGEVKAAAGAVSVFVLDAAAGEESDPRPRAGALRHGFGFDGPRFRLPLPPGRYQLTVALGHSRTAPRTVELQPDRTELDLGQLAIDLVPFDRLGEVLPDWEVASVDNLAPERATLAALRGQPLLVVFDQWGGWQHHDPDLRHEVAALASHPRRTEFRVVLFDTSERAPKPWPEPDAEPPEPAVERQLPCIHPPPQRNADVLYGSRWAIVALDAAGRLVHCGRDLAAATAAIERLLPPPTGR